VILALIVFEGIGAQLDPGLDFQREARVFLTRLHGPLSRAPRLTPAQAGFRLVRGACWR